MLKLNKPFRDEDFFDKLSFFSTVNIWIFRANDFFSISPTFLCYRSLTELCYSDRFKGLAARVENIIGLLPHRLGTYRQGDIIMIMIKTLLCDIVEPKSK